MNFLTQGQLVASSPVFYTKESSIVLTADPTDPAGKADFALNIFKGKYIVKAKAIKRVFIISFWNCLKEVI